MSNVKTGFFIGLGLLAAVFVFGLASGGLGKLKGAAGG